MDIPVNDDGARPAAVVVPVAGGARPVLPLWRAVITALLVAVFVAVLGTALHAQVLYLGTVGLPLGAFGALVMAGSAAVFVALLARNVYMSALTGGVTYALVGLIASSVNNQLIFTGTQSGPLPVSAVAGSIWVLGLAVVTILSVMVSWWVLRPGKEA